jgi:hypothetical protein
MGRKKAIPAPPAKPKPFKIAGRVMPLGDRDKAIAEAIGRVDAVYNDAATEAKKVKGEARIPFWKLQLETVAVHARILGLEAPTKMQIQSESQVTFVSKTEQARFINDPDYARKLIELEEHVIDATCTQSDVPSEVCEHRLKGLLGSHAAPQGIEPEDGGSGGSADHETGDIYAT